MASAHDARARCYRALITWHHHGGLAIWARLRARRAWLALGARAMRRALKAWAVASNAQLTRRTRRASLDFAADFARGGVERIARARALRTWRLVALRAARECERRHARCAARARRALGRWRVRTMRLRAVHAIGLSDVRRRLTMALLLFAGAAIRQKVRARCRHQRPPSHPPFRRSADRARNGSVRGAWLASRCGCCSHAHCSRGGVPALSSLRPTQP
jgi:hypothetical protein